MSSNLVEPRENSFVKLEFTHNSALPDLRGALDTLGRIRISKTFPALCRMKLNPPTLHLQACATVTNVDYHGNPRSSGCDPLTAIITHENGLEIPCTVTDHNNGTYSITFTPHTPGKHTLNVDIFSRPIGDTPHEFEVTPHNDPLVRLGGRGSAQLQFIQPTCVVIGQDSRVYVLDSGNSRVQVRKHNIKLSATYIICMTLS